MDATERVYLASLTKDQLIDTLDEAKAALLAVARLTRFELPELNNTDQWKRNLIDIDRIVLATLAKLTEGVGDE